MNVSEYAASIGMAGFERAGFLKLRDRFLSGSCQPLDWAQVRPVSSRFLLPFDSLERPSDVATIRSILSRLVVFKLNGGLGTSMGCTGPKSCMEVRAGETFLSLIVRQLAALNSKYGVDIPLVLMNSFNTEVQTKQTLEEFSARTGISVTVHMFNQSRYPRLDAATNEPLAALGPDDLNFWYPPGHGNALECFVGSGLCGQLTAQGKEFCFLSNGDNLGATVDTAILARLASGEFEWLSEVTPKSEADVKGGTLVHIGPKGSTEVHLLETAMVPPEGMTDFCSTRVFPTFHCNNLWFSLAAVAKKFQPGASLDLPVIVNRKSVGGRPVIQLETAVGCAVGSFRSAGIKIPRSRFRPVKTTSDMLLLQSDCFSLCLEDGTLTQESPRLPEVRLGSYHRAVADYAARFASGAFPSLRGCSRLIIDGDVTVGKGVVLKGNVVLVGPLGEETAALEIPEARTLSDAVVRVDADGAMNVDKY
jgi:UTP--glucose-1-phosphate uridylyltransferase